MNEIKERPILFKDEMIQAIIRRLKTQTRRVIKPQPTGYGPTPGNGALWYWCTEGDMDFNEERRCPYGQPGDRLWVREAWQRCEQCGAINYRASLRELHCGDCDGPLGNWKPSIHMFRSYSRIDLEITDIRAERVQDATPDDITAEGLPLMEFTGFDGINRSDAEVLQLAAWIKLWDSINGEPKLSKSDPWGRREECYISYPWKNGREIREHRGLTWYVVGNPRVWVVEFEIEEE